MLTLVTLGLGILGCGGGQMASVKPAAMPKGGDFTGVWFSPQYGEMHMMQSGQTVVAEYEKDQRTGRIEGHSAGNLLRYRWTEERELVQGRPTITRGRGYFQYRIGKDKRHYLVGEWGMEQSEIDGGPWRAYKLSNRKPRMLTEGATPAQQQDTPPGGDAEDGDDAAAADDDLEF
ncbi:MAG: hypothetical protein ACPGUV_11015 [Polyangiales bacterium]